MIRMFLVEDHPLMRATLVRLLETQEGWQVVGSADAAQEALRAIPLHAPDLVLADLSLPDLSGDRLVAQLQEQLPGLPCLIVSGHEESLYADAAIRAGARGFVMKDHPEEILEAVRTVARGEIYRSERLTSSDE